MEINKAEVQIIEKAISDIEAIELNDLQLALIGGGTTDVTFV